MRGVGELLTPAAIPQIWCVLANNGDPVSTPSVYRRFDAMGLGQDFAETPPPAARDAASFIGQLHRFSNDLEAPAFDLLPTIAALKTQTAGLPGCGLARMSGSGGTVFGLFQTQAAAEGARDALLQARPDYWAAAGMLGAR
jgi:4-diphosphocytidyl-2-C-methyl-D-erythritol kinase